MKYAHLKQIENFLTSFDKITQIKRTADMIVMIEFDLKLRLFFDLSKADSAIYEDSEFLSIKEYKAPFDIALKKRFSNAKIQAIKVPENNRILKISVSQSGSYKSLQSHLYLEFTGRFTNAIITDENNIIIEALRHIDNSYREIKPARELKQLLPTQIKEKAVAEISDFRQFFKDEFHRINEQNLASLKSTKITAIQKKINSVKDSINALENENELRKQSEVLSQNATLILANLHNLKDYERQISLVGFDGENVKINIDDNPKIAANLMFVKAKRLKQKAVGIIGERENLNEKMQFLISLKELINEAKSVSEVEILSPKKIQNKKEQMSQNVENFYINEHKISIGRNEKGNIWLLKNSKKDDIWLHIKDLPSAHVIIKSPKMSVSEQILEFAAKLCVSFSVSGAGRFEVDFTKRNNVKILNGANVNYINYKTIVINKGV